MTASTLDIEDHVALLRYLRAAGHIDRDARPHMRTLTGGVSNRTVMVQFEDSRGWVLKQALPKLRVQVDWFCDPARIEREGAGVRAFGQLTPGHVPQVIFEDRDHHLLAMQAVPQPHDNYKTLLLTGDVQADHVRQFAELLGEAHAASARQASHFSSAFADRGYFEALRLEPYYRFAAQQTPDAEPFLTALIDATLARRAALVHGDYSPKNVLIHQGRLILLDFEVAHFGDPAFDVGFAMTHYLSKAHHLATHRAALLQAATHFWQTYRAHIAEALPHDEHEPACVLHTLGCMLARVRGRSPLEYLTTPQRDRQCRIVLSCMAAPPATISALIEAFGKELNRHAHD